MNKIWVILKKELKRFFSDKRMLANLILPGVTIFVIYALMGTFMEDAFSADANHEYHISVNNMVEDYRPLFEAETDEFKIIIDEDITSIDEVKNDLKHQHIDLFIDFEEGFKDKLTAGEHPYLNIYFNSASEESTTIYQYYTTVFNTIGTTVIENILINKNPDIQYNLATDEDMSAKVVTMLLPYLLIILLFSGCFATTTESIAGEKERGTINTLLVTPTKRSHIAIGKIIALSITGLVSATSSFIGLICSIPFLMGNMSEGGFTLNMYSFGTYISIYFIILVTIMFFTSILSIISTYAKNVKEASQLGSVLMMVVMVIGVTSLMGGGSIPTNHLVYLIPVYNSVQAMSSIFAMQINIVNFIITIVSNIVYITVSIILLAKMFDSEKIMSSN